ncbi:hypothetical protein Tco_1043726 [Tanacetum coccineum]|uniref:Uncharacterized protein n=1 Tax=Tanacetum coccineum TaxID=301880 RepID=A0ABQ5GMX7_9ASTR
MSSNSDDIQAAGSDTRPPMLDRTDYESWSQRIRLYCRGKENGLQILQSIDQGPFELGTTRDALETTPEGGVLLGPERPCTYEDLSDTEKKRYDADVPKAIWDNVKMLLAGSELTKEDRESQLYDEFERFKMLPGQDAADASPRNGAVLDEEELLFLADVDNEPTAQSIFMVPTLSLSRCVSKSTSGHLCFSILSEAKKAQPVLYDGDELLKPYHVPVMVLSSEEELELAKATRNKLHVKINDSACVEKVGSRSPSYTYSKENFMATFTPQTQLTPEQGNESAFENLEAEVDQNETDLRSGEIERINLLITNENLVDECLSKDVFYFKGTGGIKKGFLKGAIRASRSKPRSNTKKDRTLPAKSALKQVEAHSRMNKSNKKHKNRVESSISYKRTVINSNSNTSCKTCNKCLNSVNHDQCVVPSEMCVKQSSATKVWRVKQVKQVWKATGKLFTTIGYQWRPTGRLLPLGDQWPLTRNTPPKVLPTKQWMPTGRLLLLERQYPLVRSTAFKSDYLPADP